MQMCTTYRTDDLSEWVQRSKDQRRRKTVNDIFALLFGEESAAGQTVTESRELSLEERLVLED